MKENKQNFTPDTHYFEADPTNHEKGYIVFQYGSKTLNLGYEPEGDIINVATLIYTDDSLEKKDDETTFLYNTAKQFMQKLAHETQKIIVYCLTTENAKMILWAKTKGRNLFQWTKEELPSHGPAKFTVTFKN